MKRSTVRRTAAAVLLTLALVVVPAAFAGKGGGGGKPSGGGGSSLSLVMVTDQNGDGLPNRSDQVTFNVSTTATTRPYVYVACSQNGAEVYTSSAGFFPEYLWPWQRTFTLYSDRWTGAPADCTARLYHFDGRRTRDLASLSFHVGA